METNIIPVSNMEGEESKRLMEIRFDCLVKMYDVARPVKEIEFLPFLKTERALTPQWFKLNARLTMEAIKYSNEYELGRMIKDMYRQLEKQINQYEQSKL